MKPMMLASGAILGQAVLAAVLMATGGVLNGLLAGVMLVGAWWSAGDAVREWRWRRGSDGATVAEIVHTFQTAIATLDARSVGD